MRSSADGLVAGMQRRKCCTHVNKGHAKGSFVGGNIKVDAESGNVAAAPTSNSNADPSKSRFASPALWRAGLRRA